MRLDQPTLGGRFVLLEPLQRSMAMALVAAGNEDRSTYTWTAVPATVAAMEDYIDTLLADRDDDAAVPFAQRRSADGALIGCTRLLRIEWWGGRGLPAEVEIGGTWLAASAQRTAINTEAKLLLLTYAFDELRVDRVSICTDARNDRSRTAIARIGATFEGVLRNHRASYVAGEGARDTAVYSIIPNEWPAARAALNARLR